MKQIKVNPSNKPYYSEDFIKGFECGTKAQFDADKELICNAIIVPKNATNGDMMKALFPNINFHDMAFTVHAETNVTSNGVKGVISYDFWKEWWNTSYEGEKNE